MGAVIGAAYAAGHTPKQIKEIAKTTDWKQIIDFTIPKSGLLKGELIEGKIRKLLKNSSFKNLEVPLAVVSYNLTKKKRVVFRKGNVARAVRASMSIPGIFNPITIDGDIYIDGVVSDPTPFDVVKDMGADVIIAVDLYNKDDRAVASAAQEGSLFKELKRKFILDELFNVKNYLFPARWPHFARKISHWLFDKILYPAKVFKIMAGRKLPDITRVMYESMNVLSNNYARERIANAKVDIVLTPRF